MTRSVIGAVFGDISGSIYEFNNLKTKNVSSIKLYDERCYFTDDTVMTLIVAEGLRRAKKDGDIEKAVNYIYDLVDKIAINHKEGIKGAEAVVVCGIMAKQKKSKEEIRKYINDNYYKLDFTIDEIRPYYTFDETCQGTVPQAIELFLESSNFDNAIQLAISLGGDCDTTACIVGSIAGQFYDIPNKVNGYNQSRLSDDLLDIYNNL